MGAGAMLRVLGLRVRVQVAAGCMVGAGTTMGDKCSVKRSVLGPMCKLGAGVKVINSVLMEGCTVGDGCHLQNSILCSGAHLQVRTPRPHTAAANKSNRDGSHPPVYEHVRAVNCDLARRHLYPCQPRSTRAPLTVLAGDQDGCMRACRSG